MHRLFSTTLSDLPATERAYFDSPEGDPVDVQAVLSAADDGGPLVYIGEYVFDKDAAEELQQHLARIVVALHYG